MTAEIFWTAVQGTGAILAAIAAIIALVIAGRQLGQLIASNRLLAASNDAMTESNIALNRPFVVVDFEFSSSVSRQGDAFGTAVFVMIRNDGKTPAHNITMTVDHPFAPLSEPNTEGWRKSVDDLNRLMNGRTLLHSLTSTRSLKYYFDGQELFGKEDEPAPQWRIDVRYEDGEGREFRDSFTLEVEAWRRSVIIVDPLKRIGKYINSVAHEVKTLNSTIEATNRAER